MVGLGQRVLKTLLAMLNKRAYFAFDFFALEHANQITKSNQGVRWGGDGVWNPTGGYNVFYTPSFPVNDPGSL